MITKKLASVLSVAIVATSFLMLATVSHAFGQGCQTSIFAFLTIPQAFGQLCTPPPSGMISWWPGDDNANDIKDGNPGTLQGDATFAAGKVDKAFSFDGSGDFVEVADNANLDFGSSNHMTIDAWVNGHGTHILGKRVGCSGASVGINYQLAAPGGALEFNSFGDGIFAAGTVPADTWTHIAATYDGSSLNLYVNGALVGSTSYTLSGENNDPLKIGSSGTCAGDWNGLIDEVEIYNTALSDVEIKDIFDAGSAGKCKVTQSPQAVGGTIMPVDMTALFVAGTFTNAFWILPTLGGIAGAALALFKIKRRYN